MGSNYSDICVAPSECEELYLRQASLLQLLMLLSDSLGGDMFDYNIIRQTKNEIRQNFCHRMKVHIYINLMLMLHGTERITGLRRMFLSFIFVTSTTICDTILKTITDTDQSVWKMTNCRI